MELIYKYVLSSIICISDRILMCHGGIGFSQEQCDSLRELLQVKLAALEQQAYELAGHSFSLTSPDDISKVGVTCVAT